MGASTLQRHICHWPVSDQGHSVCRILTEHLDAEMNQEGAGCETLLQCTIDALDRVELQKLLISAQQANINLNIESAVE